MEDSRSACYGCWPGVHNIIVHNGFIHAGPSFRTQRCRRSQSWPLHQSPPPPPPRRRPVIANHQGIQAAAAAGGVGLAPGGLPQPCARGHAVGLVPGGLPSALCQGSQKECWWEGKAAGWCSRLLPPQPTSPPPPPPCHDEEDNGISSCPVCFEEGMPIVVTTCGHGFCQSCLMLSSVRWGECSMCRHPLSTEEVGQLPVFFGGRSVGSCTA